MIIIIVFTGLCIRYCQHLFKMSAHSLSTSAPPLYRYAGPTWTNAGPPPTMPTALAQVPLNSHCALHFIISLFFSSLSLFLMISPESPCISVSLLSLYLFMFVLLCTCTTSFNALNLHALYYTTSFNTLPFLISLMTHSQCPFFFHPQFLSDLSPISLSLPLVVHWRAS